MADTFSLTGSLATTPLDGDSSGALAVLAQLGETVVLEKKEGASTYELDADAPKSVSFGPVTNAQVVMAKVSGPKVTLRLTSAEAAGAPQDIPCDGFAIIIAQGTPFTALDLVRTPGQVSNVTIFLGGT